MARIPIVFQGNLNALCITRTVFVAYAMVVVLAALLQPKPLQLPFRFRNVCQFVFVRFWMRLTRCMHLLAMKRSSYDGHRVQNKVR